MIRLFILVIFSAFVTACVNRPVDFSLPDIVQFDGQRYQKITDNRLDEMRQLLYLPSDGAKDPENWQQGILFFLDKNTIHKSLEERLTLREKLFEKQSNLQKKLVIEDGELRSQIIYPPTDRFHNIQLELSRGRNLPCGFGQIQFSNKRSITTENLTKNSVDLTADQLEIAQLAEKFILFPWLIECK